MKTRIEKNLLLNDCNTPEMVYATFNENLSKRNMKEISLILNYGYEMLQVYKANRDNLHISNVAEMIQKMEEIFHKFDCESLNHSKK